MKTDDLKAGGVLFMAMLFLLQLTRLIIISTI